MDIRRRRQSDRGRVQAIGYAFIFSNSYLILAWLAYSVIQIPRSGPIYVVLWIVSLLVAMIVLALFVTMFIHMIRSRISIGRKIMWCVAFLVTSIAGSTFYYYFSYRRAYSHGSSTKVD